MARVSRIRVMPWIMAFQLAVTLHKHWKLLEPKERARLAELVKKSQGQPAKLSSTERKDVRRLVTKLEPMVIARSAVPIARRAAKARRGL